MLASFEGNRYQLRVEPEFVTGARHAPRGTQLKATSPIRRALAVRQRASRKKGVRCFMPLARPLDLRGRLERAVPLGQDIQEATRANSCERRPEFSD